MKSWWQRNESVLILRPVGGKGVELNEFIEIDVKSLE